MRPSLSHFLLAAIFALPALAGAQTSMSAASPQASGMAAGSGTGDTLLHLVERGGPLVYLLAAISFVCTILIVLYAFTIRPGTVVNATFLDMAEVMLQKGDYVGLANHCRRTNQCVARVIGRAMDFLAANPKARLEEVRDVAQAEGARQAGMLIQRISYLADIAAVAPMVGLLGTVLGMIKSFSSISDGSFATARQMQLAAGVSEALINTAGGLVICIPAMIFYAIFRGKVQRLISEMEAVCTHLLAVFSVEFQGSLKPRRLPSNFTEEQPARQQSEPAPRYREEAIERP